MEYSKKYKNGLRLVVKEIPTMYSVTIGVCVGTGSTNEDKDNNGISHFIEHMLFKGTASRTAFDISDSIDRIGGQINAFTSKEMTCYYTRVTDKHVEKSFDILSDIFFRSKFDEGEMEKEKSVVLEEIAMVEDAPDEVCQELISKAFYQDNPLGQTILGTEKNVKAFSRKGILDYLEKFYCPENVVISLAGKVTFEEADKLVKKYFENEFENESDVVENGSERHTSKSAFLFRGKDTEQAHLCLAYPSKSFGDPDVVALMVFNNIFGGGMSSRLFQKVREEKGLAYSVYSYLSAYRNNGLFTVYAGINPKNIEKTVETIKKEADAILKKGFSKDEFIKGKEQLKGAFILGQESTAAVMTLNAKYLLLNDAVFKTKNRIKEIDSVTQDKVMELLESTFDTKSLCSSLVCKESEKKDLLEVYKNC